MRILVVSPQFPYPPASGFNIRVTQMLPFLSRRHSVTLLTYAPVGAELGDGVAWLSALCDAVHVVPGGSATSSRKRIEQLLSLASSRSFQGRYLYSQSMQRTLDELCRAEPFDVIQLETSQLATFSFDPRSSVVVVEHDIVYELLHRIASAERSWFRRVYNGAEARKYAREEPERWKRAAACVVTSSREVDIVRAAGVTTPVLVVPNGVDTEYFRPSAVAPEPDTLVMTGLMSTRPNIDAAVHFATEVFPTILAARPTARVYIVGGDPPDEVSRLANDAVIVTGSVPDVRPYVHKAAVVVVPLRMGGGTRLKVLEGLSMKKPMVSTSIGCEGIDVANDEHVLVADTPSAFAAATLRLLDDAATRCRLAERGHALVYERYEWERAFAPLDALYDEIRRSHSS